MSSQTIILIVIGVLVFLLFMFQVSIIFSKREQKWKGILDPTNLNYTANKEMVLDRDQKKKRKKNQGITLKQKFHNSNFFLKWSKKFENWYWQAGEYNKGFDNFLVDAFKYGVLGIILGLLLFLFVGNILIALFPAILLILLPAIGLWEKIGRRRSQFREKFPFFLRTLSFVLQNGANPNTAIVDVTSKLQDGILKECMEDVIVAQTSNGGDFVRSFEVIRKKVKLEEVEDFVNILRNNEEKGVGISESFMNQSEMLTRIINNKKTKKLNNVENKILLPILLIIGALVLLVLAI